MKKYKMFFILALILNVNPLLYCKSPELVEYKRIGDERDNYIFFLISSALLTKEKNIIIADKKGHFISKFNWNGEFLKKIGREGSGPGDIRLITSIDQLNQNLYFYDFGNRRIFKTDHNINFIKYLNLKDKTIYFHETIKVLKDGKFAGDCSNTNFSEKYKIKIFNKSGIIKKSFFSESPIRSLNNNPKSFILSIYTDPIFNINNKKDKFIVSFRFPDNPVTFFIYDLDGKRINKFNFFVEKRFSFPRKRYKNIRKKIKNLNYLAIDSLFFHKNKYIFFIYKIEKTFQNIKSNLWCFICSDKGKLEDKFRVDKHFRFFYMSKDGFLLARDEEAEFEQLHILKLVE